MTITNELNPEMKTTMNINNTIFVYAFVGVVLFIATLAFTVANLPAIMALKLSSLIIAGMLGFASISLLTKAIKADKRRLNEQL